MSALAPPGLGLDEALTKKMTSDSTVCWSLEQNVIVTTEDKLVLRINEHLDGIDAKRRWIAPTSILVTLVATLCTTTFKKFIGLEGAVWHSLFVLGVLVTGIWSLAAGVKAVRNWNSGVPKLLEAIKRTSGGTHTATLSIEAKGQGGG